MLSPTTSPCGTSSHPGPSSSEQARDRIRLGRGDLPRGDHALENRACKGPHPDLETIRIWTRCPDEREEARTEPPRLAIPSARRPVRSGRLTANLSHSRGLRVDHRHPLFDASLWQSHSVVNPAIEPE